MSGRYAEIGTPKTQSTRAIVSSGTPHVQSRTAAVRATTDPPLAAPAVTDCSSGDASVIVCGRDCVDAFPRTLIEASYPCTANRGVRWPLLTRCRKIDALPITAEFCSTIE